MQTKTKNRPRRNALRDYKPRTKPRSVVEPLPQEKDARPIQIIGRDPAGNIVAEDRHDAHWKAGQVAAGWKASGLTVEIIETGHPKRSESAGAGSRLDPSGSI